MHRRNWRGIATTGDTGQPLDIIAGPAAESAQSRLVGGVLIAVAVKDADRRAVILQKLYAKRHAQSWVGLPLEAHTQEEQIIEFNICNQLHQSGLIEFKPMNPYGGAAQISNLGVDVIEGNAKPPIAISIDRSISVSGSTFVQIGNDNTQDIRIDADKIVAAINHAAATSTEKEDAKTLFQKVLENPLLSKIFGLFTGGG
jgi:hypothetical protein